MDTTYFQYRAGVVSQSHRVVHTAFGEVSEESAAWTSWCRREFPGHLVEITAKPGERPEAGQATPCAPCVQCLLVFTAAIDGPADDPMPVRAPDEKPVAVILRRAQWLLDDAADHINQGRCGKAEYAELATTLDDLAKMMRERAEVPHVVEEPHD